MSERETGLSTPSIEKDMATLLRAALLEESLDSHYQVMKNRIAAANSVYGNHDQTGRMRAWVKAASTFLRETGAGFDLYIDGIVLETALADLSKGVQPPLLTPLRRATGTNPAITIEGRIRIELLALIEMQRFLDPKRGKATLESASDALLLECRQHLNANGVLLHQAFFWGKPGISLPTGCDDGDVQCLEICRGRLLTWRKAVRRPKRHSARPKWFTIELEERLRLFMDVVKIISLHPDKTRGMRDHFASNTFEVIVRYARR